MSKLEEFRSKLKSRVAAAGNVPGWQSADTEAYMAALRLRRQQFDDSAKSLLARVITPRLEVGTEPFPSARTMTDEQACRCWCWFASSDRFPITAKVEFAVEHDESVERMFVRFDGCLMPVFVRFQPHDKLTFRLNEINPDQIAD